MKKRREYRNRLILGPILIVTVGGAFYLDEMLEGRAMPSVFSWTGLDHIPPGILMFPVIAGITILASRELAGILASRGVAGSKRVVTVAALAGLVCSTFIPKGFTGTDGAAIVAIVAVLVLALSMVFYARHRSVEWIIAATGGALLSFVYLGLMFGSMLTIRHDHSALVVLWIILVTKSCDMGAYFTGRAIGKHKLIPWLSPGKTWEGLWGGLAVSTLMGYLGLLLLHKVIEISMPPVLLALIPGAVFGFVGQVGDLMESAFKRDAGRKDSGSTLPGMGGVLDVLDSVLLVCPLAYWWLTLMHAHGYMVKQ